MWARGLDDRPSTLTFAPPAGARWQVATQLHPGASAVRVHRAEPAVPDGQPGRVRAGVDPTVHGRTAARFASPRITRGTDAELDAFVKDVEKIVRQEGAVFGEFPDYEPGSYTFLADYLPYANGDGMEHRNSTVMTVVGLDSRRPRAACSTRWRTSSSTAGTSSASARGRSSRSISSGRTCRASCGSPKASRSTTARSSLQRAGLADLPSTRRRRSPSFVESAVVAAGRAVRSAEEMSRMAAFTDGGRTDRSHELADTYISYYPFGGAIALALDLTLRERSDGRVTLDDFMRAMWRVHGKPGGAREGYVDRPYTVGRRRSAAGGGQRRRGVRRATSSAATSTATRSPTTRALLARAGFALQPRSRGTRLVGRPPARAARRPPADRRFSSPPTPPPMPPASIRTTSSVSWAMPASTCAEDVVAAVQRHQPGDRIAVAYVDRTGVEKTTTVTLAADPHLEVRPIEPPAAR